MEQIEGKSKQDVLQRLKEKKTLINVHLLGTEFERISLVVDIVAKGKVNYLMMDYMKGFREASAAIDPWRLRFEFTGADKLQYSFKTVGGEIAAAGKGILVPFPDTIVRKQRRRYFRLEAPPNAEMAFKSGGTAYRLKLLDISLGGAQVLLPLRKPAKKKDFPVVPNRTLYNLELTFPGEDTVDTVKVVEAVVLRAGALIGKEREFAAVRFTSMTKEEEQNLNRIIYRFQRLYLRKRHMA